MLDIQFTEEFLICYKNDTIDVNVHIPVIVDFEVNFFLHSSTLKFLKPEIVLL